MEQVGMKLDVESPSKWRLEDQDKLVQPPVRNEAFLSVVERLGLRMSSDADTRIFHSHGHTCHEMFKLRSGQPLGRVPDSAVMDGAQLCCLASSCWP